jgi:hypothetical protein
MLIGLGNLKNDRVVDTIERVVSQVSDHLFEDIDHDMISVGFEIDNDMVVDGYCTQEDHDDYTIELRSDLRGEELERTIIHELVHIWQYVRGDLIQEHIDGLGPRMIWMGEDMTSVDYDNRPWEREAVDLEERYHKQLVSL